MRKIRKKVLNSFCAAGLTRKEQDLFLYLCRYQNVQGNVAGVFYKDVCDQMEMTPQSFYTSLRKLQKSGMIHVESPEYRKLRNAVDWNIAVLNNDCSNYKIVLQDGGYLSLADGFYASPDFWALKAGAKAVAMQICTWCRSSKVGKYVIGSANFLKKFAEQLGVGIRTVRRYLESLKKLFVISRWKKNITFKVRPDLKAVIPGSDSDADLIRKQHVRTACCEYGIRIPDDTALKDAADLEKQYPVLGEMLQKKEMDKYQGNPFLWLLSRKEYNLREDGDGSQGKRILGPKYLHGIIIAKVNRYKETGSAPVPDTDPAPDTKLPDSPLISEEDGSILPQISLEEFAKQLFGDEEEELERFYDDQ